MDKSVIKIGRELKKDEVKCQKCNGYGAYGGDYFNDFQDQMCEDCKGTGESVDNVNIVDKGR